MGSLKKIRGTNGRKNKPKSQSENLIFRVQFCLFCGICMSVHVCVSGQEKIY